MQKYSGIKERSKTIKDKEGNIIKDGAWQVNFRPYKGAKSTWRTVPANSKGEAYLKRAELMLEARKAPALDFNEAVAREGLTFDTILPVLERNIIADGLTHKTLLGLKRVYNRLFTDFRLKKYPHVTTPADLSLPYFLEYKSYYGVELGKPKGLRAETQRLKIIMNRLRKLRYVSEELMRDLKEIKTPERRKKAYPEITPSSIKALFSRIKTERPDLYGALYFMLRTGRRVEETTLIERKDVAWDDKLNPIRINIRAETTKMNTAAPLNYLDQDLQSHIRFYYQLSKQHKSPFLFLNRQFDKIKMNALTEYLGDLSEQEDMLKTRITCHYLRHRFCTETCKAKLPLVDIQAISGIKDIATLIGNYCHSSPDGQASVLEKTRL